MHIAILCISAVAICTGRVEAKQSKTGRVRSPSGSCNLHGACGGKEWTGADKYIDWGCNLHGACGGKAHPCAVSCYHLALQSARGVWRQRLLSGSMSAVMLLQSARGVWRQSCKDWICCCKRLSCNLHGACGGKAFLSLIAQCDTPLQSARGVWRQSVWGRIYCPAESVAICTGRVEAKLRIIK